MRPPGDARHFLRAMRGGDGEEPVEELHAEPDRQKDDRADLDHRPIDDQRQEREDARPRPQDQKRAEDAGNASRRADRRHGRVRKEHRVRQAADRAADDEKDKVADVPERILDRATEDPEVNHVADEVHEPAVQKERGDERDRHLEDRIAVRRRMDEPGGDETERC